MERTDCRVKGRERSKKYVTKKMRPNGRKKQRVKTLKEEHQGML